MIGSGAYDRHVRQCRIRYRSRRDRLAAVLRQQAAAVTVRGIAAWLHALVELPAGGPAEAEIVALARKRHIAVEGLAQHWMEQAAHPPGLVVGYATPAAHAFDPGLHALARLLGDLTGTRRR